MKVFIVPVANTNLFPFTIRPVSIQSVQQAQLIQQAIADNIPVAIGFHIESEPTFRSIAGYGLPYIADKRLDGSLLMYIQGQGKVNLSQSVTVSNGIITYNEVTEVLEDYELNERTKNQYTALSKYFAHWIDRYIVNPGQKDFFLKSLVGAREVISACAAYLVKDFEMQYELMELTNVNDQIQYLYGLMLSKQLIF